MTLENLLRRYPTYKAELNITKLTIKGIELDIIEGSPAPSDGMPRGTDTSNPTEAKAMRVLQNASSYERYRDLMQLKVDVIENALSVLTDKEKTVIDRLYFRQETYAKIDYEAGIPRGTCKRLKNESLSKMEPLLSILLGGGEIEAISI